MKNNKVRLTEAQLHQVIKESVKNVLKEDEFNRNNYDKYFGLTRPYKDIIESDGELIYQAANRVFSYCNNDNVKQFLGNEFIKKLSDAAITLQKFVEWVEEGEEPIEPEEPPTLRALINMNSDSY